MDLLFTMVLWTVTAPVWLLLVGLMWIILLSPIWMTVWMIDRGRSKRAWARLKAHYEGYRRCASINSPTRISAGI